MDREVRNAPSSGAASGHSTDDDRGGRRGILRPVHDSRGRAPVAEDDERRRRPALAQHHQRHLARHAGRPASGRVSGDEHDRPERGHRPHPDVQPQRGPDLLHQARGDPAPERPQPGFVLGVPHHFPAPAADGPGLADADLPQTGRPAQPGHGDADLQRTVVQPVGVPCASGFRQGPGSGGRTAQPGGRGQRTSDDEDARAGAGAGGDGADQRIHPDLHPALRLAPAAAASERGPGDQPDGSRPAD